MSGSQIAPYTIGRNCTLILIWSGVRIQLNQVTGFQSNQEVKRQRVDPLTGVPVEFTTPSGWRGRFMVDRADSAVDDLIAQIEAGFWAFGLISSGVIYQYITETNGTQNTYEFTGVSLELTDAGNFQAENVVRQTLAFFASQRNKLS